MGYHIDIDVPYHIYEYYDFYSLLNFDWILCTDKIINGLSSLIEFLSLIRKKLSLKITRSTFVFTASQPTPAALPHEPPQHDECRGQTGVPPNPASPPLPRGIWPQWGPSPPPTVPRQCERPEPVYDGGRGRPARAGIPAAGNALQPGGTGIPPAPTTAA